MNRCFTEASVVYRLELDLHPRTVYQMKPSRCWQDNNINVWNKHWAGGDIHAISATQIMG